MNARQRRAVRRQQIQIANYTVMVECVRSFSFKLNVGNYESRDFFMSQKAECRLEDAEIVSERLHQFCKSQVLKSVREYQEERRQYGKTG